MGRTMRRTTRGLSPSMEQVKKGVVSKKQVTSIETIYY